MERLIIVVLFVAGVLQAGCDDSEPLLCDEGHVLEDGECVDIDECALGGVCPESSICVNTDGSYSCECDVGFNEVGGRCVDIDECLGQGGGHDCSANASCGNTPGSFRCVCDEGYLGDGHECEDADECAGEGGGHDCDERAVCTNTPGSFSCACVEGYGGDGRECVDYDECAGEGGGHDCDGHAVCLNEAGGFTCECEGGYEGDGRVCERSREAGLVILNATLIDGTGAAALSNAALVIVEGGIAEVGLMEEVHVYSDDEQLDVEERFVVPGVINAHVHGSHSPENLEVWAQAGVTTVRDVGAPLSPPDEWGAVSGWDDWAAAIFAGAELAERIPPAFDFRDEELSRPESARALMSGPCLTAVGGYPGGDLSLHVNDETVVEGGVEITPVDDARRKTELLADAGADVIKICIENHWGTQSWGLLSEAQIGAIVEAAQSAGLRVTAHVSADEQVSRVVSADPPVHSLAHIAADRMSDENIAALVDLDVTLVPTLAVWESLSWICSGFGACDGVENLGRFVTAGGTVALGDDYFNPGIVLGMPMRDLELMSTSGMSNMEMLLAATRDAASECGMADELGTLESGKIADVLILNSDPLDDFAAFADVAWVIHDGVVIREP